MENGYFDKQQAAVPVEISPLPILLRFYIYGLQGFCDEVIFTAICDFLKSGDYQLKGQTALSSFFMYGSCSLFVERLYLVLYYQYGLRWYFRMPLYLLICYSWELSWGLSLRYFDACPWDYSHMSYNFLGLITLQYAPGWLFLCWLQDVVADYLLRVRVLAIYETGELESKKLN